MSVSQVEIWELNVDAFVPELLALVLALPYFGEWS